MLKRRRLLIALGLFAAPSASWSQPPQRIYRIGYIRGEKSPEDDINGFKQGLRERGYVEGKNIVVEYRWGDGNEKKLRSLVSELIDLKVDLIVTSAPAATQAAKDATTTIPIVMVLVADPVGYGIVNSYARPGGNVTGFAFLLPVISGKRLELLKETIPRLARVAVLWNAANSYKEDDLKEVQAVANALKITMVKVPVHGPNDLDRALNAAMKSRPGGLITLDDPFTIARSKQIVDLAAKHRLPAIYAVKPYMDAGGLMFYGPDRFDQNRRAGVIIDKILKGAKPADIPVEQPTKFEFVANIKTANALGLKIPQSILLRAEQLIQ